MPLAAGTTSSRKNRNAEDNQDIAVGYAAAARRENQPYLSDLVPLGYLPYAFGVIGCALLLGLLQAGYYWTRAVSAGPVSLVFDLESSTSLSAWISAIAIAACAPLSALIYLVRRHKLDDYRGRYRLWLGMVGLSLLVSMDQTAAVQEGLRAWLHRTTGWSWLGPGAAWWSMAGALLVSGLAIRMGFEIRTSRPATALLGIALVLWFGAQAALRGWFSLEQTPTVMIGAGLQLGSQLLVPLMLALYARQITLVANGKVSDTGKRPKRLGQQAGEPLSKAVVQTSQGGELRIDPAQKPRGPVSARTDLDPPARSGAQPSRASTAAPSPRAVTPVKVTVTAAPDKPAAAATKEAAKPGEQSSAAREAGPQRTKLTKAERKALKRQRRQEGEDEELDWWEQQE